jgi:malonyl-CoA O-methyltransferase
MNIIKEFSRFANSYGSLNLIQKNVAYELISMLDKKYYDTILDIGSGDGAIFNTLLKKDISFNNFIALDFSKEMLDLHPSSSKVKKLYLDFNSIDCFSKLSSYDLVISSSALQWSRNLDLTLREISILSDDFYFAIFTSNTFKTLHKTANIKSPIYSKDIIESYINRYFFVSNSFVKSYKLFFENVFEMFKYIKRSGVSGGKKQLLVKDIKRVVKNYPFDYLEFEVFFIKASSKLRS